MHSGETCEQALAKMRQTGFEQFPVKDEKGQTYGIITQKNLLMRLYKNHVQLQDPIKRVVARELRTVSMEMTLNELSRVLTRTNFAVVDDKYCVHISDVLDKLAPHQEIKSVPATKEERGATTTVKAVKKEEQSALLSATLLTLGALVGVGASMLLKK